jgi:hypothetical protein
VRLPLSDHAHLCSHSRPLDLLHRRDDNPADETIDPDHICPFCYLGKKKLEAAVARLPAGSVDVSYDWRAFELDSTLPLVGVDKMTSLLCI